MVVDQQDVDTWFYVAMLESIIEQHHIDILLTSSQFFNTMHAVFVDSHRDLGIFLFHLERLIANVMSRGCEVGHYKTLRLALIASAQHSHLRQPLKQFYQIFHMRRLSCAAHCDVAHRDNWQGEGTALQDTHLEEGIPEAYYQSVEPAQRCQPLIDLDKIAFHLMRDIDITTYLIVVTKGKRACRRLR